MSLYRLKNEMEELIKLSYKIGQHDQMLFHLSEIKNYNESKYNNILTTKKELKERFDFLYEKWF